MAPKVLITLIIFSLNTLAFANGASFEKDQLLSSYGHIAACDMNDYTSSDQYTNDCPMLGDDENGLERSNIVFNGKVLWSDEGRHVRFVEKHVILNAQNRKVETFIFYTSTGGTSCPMELTVVVVSPEGINVQGPFGNCMDTEGIRIEPVKEGVNFLFECGNTLDCRSNQTEYAYHCFISNDINQEMTCSGNDYCSSYSESIDNSLFYWDDEKRTAEVVPECKKDL